MSNWWESSPVDGNTSDNAASKNWWDEHPKEEASQDSALTRGITQAKSAAKTAKALSIGDYETVAQLAAERDAYRKANPGTKEGNELMSAWDSGDGIAGGIKNVVGEIGKDWKEAPSTFDALRATGKNLSAMGGGIVEQVPNMVMPMTGMLAGGAAGSTVGGPFGAVVGGWAGATAGNAAAESPEQVDRALQSAGIDPQDTAAAKSYLDANGGKIAGQALTKGAIIGAVDTATMGIGGKVLTAPARAAADRALREMGVDLADKAAVKAAQRTTEFANKIGADAVYQASQKGAQAFTRNTAVGALEPAGEFAGEYFGQGAATGDWDTKGATLEALSSLGQSGITFAGQKAYQYATNPFSKATANTDTPKADVPRVNDYTLVTDPAPIQQRIDAMLRIDRSAINEKERIAYEKAWSDALNEPVGITHDENGIEKPLTMGAYLDAQDQARQIAELRARQNQDPNTATVPNQDGTETVIDRRDGPLSAAAVSSVKNGVLRERDFVPPPSGNFGQMNEFADLLNSERQDVEGQRQKIATTQQLRRDSAMETTDARVEAQRLKETAQKRDALLANVLDNLPEGQNPKRAFDRALRSLGFTNLEFRPEETARINHWQGISQNAESDTIPAAPNELDAAAMGIRERRVETPEEIRQRAIAENRNKLERTRQKIAAQQKGQSNGGIPASPINAEVATPSIEVGRGELPGSGTVLASAPIGDNLGASNRPEVAGPGVRSTVAAGSPGANGLDNLTQGISNGVKTDETFPQETQRAKEPAAPVAPEVKGYKLGQAKMISGRRTNQGLPSEIYPHPTQEGMYAIRPQGNAEAGPSPKPIDRPSPTPQSNDASLPSSVAQRLQEAHKALGYDVTRKQVQAMRDRVANEIESGTINNGGVVVRLKPSAISERKQRLSRLDADLALFDLNGSGPSAKAKPEQPAVEVRANGKNPIMRRNDLVGAIMRVTGGRGINSNMAQTLVGDTANNATRLRGLFTNQGQQDMDDLAMLLREQEGFDVRDASHMEDLVREAAAGNVAVSMARQEELKNTEAEKQHRDNVRQKAKSYGIKTVARKFEDITKDVAAHEMAEQQQAEDKAILEREAIQSAASEEVSDATINELARLAADHDGRYINEEWISNDEILDAFESIGEGGEEQTPAGAGETVSAETGGSDSQRSEEARPDLALEGQTPAEVRAQEAQRRAEEEAANKPAPDTSPKVKADQPDIFNTQSALFNNNRETPAEPKKQKSIPELQAELKKADPFSRISGDLNGKLIERVAEDAQQAIDSGIAPTYGTGQGTFVVIHPSAQNEGMIQVTRYSERGVFGDSQYNTLKQAVSDNVLWTKSRMTQDEADAALKQSLEAEAEYQRKREEFDRHKTLQERIAANKQKKQAENTERAKKFADLVAKRRAENAFQGKYRIEEETTENGPLFHIVATGDDGSTAYVGRSHASREMAERALQKLAPDESTNPEKLDTSAERGKETAKNQAVTQEETAADRVPATIEKAETDMTPDWDSFAEFWNGLIEGKGTIDDVKKSFALLVDEADAFRATIAKMKNDQLKRMLGWIARPDDKKADLVRKVYDQTLGRFTLNKSAPSKQWTYGETMEAVNKRYQDQLRSIIDGLTDADLTEFRDSIAENKKERADELEKNKAAAADPKTIEDFELNLAYSRSTGKTIEEARAALTPEQRATWDSLLAERSRTARQNNSASQKTEVIATTVTTEGQIVETNHTRTGEDLFVVKAAERVDRDVYNQWNATAKRLGGWYSSFRGNGAVPGFQFKTRENANAFLKFLGGDVAEAKEVVQERRDAYADDRSQTAVERLMEMADRLDERADESLGRERKANTDRRARFAAAAENAAQSDKALAKTMRNIAEAIQNGTAKLLDRVRQKTQVEMLQEFVRNAKDAELRSKYPAYIDQERHKGEPADIDTAEFAQWPTYSAERSDLANLARQLLETDGTKKLGQQLLKIADDITAEYKKFAKENLHKVSVFKASREGSAEKTEAVFSTQDAAERAIARSGYNGKATTISFKRGEHLVIMGPTMAREAGVWKGDDQKRITLSSESGAELVEKLGRVARTNRDAPRIPWQFENAYDKRKRLAAIGIETPAEFRSALREFIGLRETPKEADRVKEMERAMIGRKNDGLDFFPTPKNVAQQMIDAAELKEGMNVLEPSAGWGHIAEMIRDAGVDPEVIELSGDRRELLEAKGFNVVGSDFLDASGQYDRVLMNPPFSDRRDAQHVQHAYSLLRPGGRLVAIMGEGVFFGQDKKAEAFRNWLEEVGGTSEQLEEGSFLDSSLPVNTGVNARLVVIDKPEGKADQTDNAVGNKANDGRITPADKAIYGMASEGKSAADILKFIADTSRNPFYRQLARLLQKTGIAPKIVVGTSDGWKFNDGEGKYAAAYNPKTDTVALFRPASSERNMLHELIHAATLKALSKRGLAAVQMKKLFEHVAKSGKLKGMYGMANVDEFVAEAFSNRHFQDMLKKVDAPSSTTGLKGAWHWFVRIVRGILGVHTGDENALSAALEIGVGVMRENMALQSGEAGIKYSYGLIDQIKPTGNNGDFDATNPDIRYNIIGDSGRAYDARHRAFFKNVGRDVDRQNVIEKTLDYLKSDFWKKMAVGIVDQFRGLRDLNDGGQAYLLARLSKGTAGAFDTLLHHGKLSLKDGVYDGDTSGGFVERLGVPLNGELDDFLWWVAANRAEKLTADGKENLFSPQDIQAGKSLAAGLTTFDYTIQTGQSKGTTTRNRQVIYQDALRVFNEFQKNVLDLSEQSGLIDGSSRQYWESEFYVPFYRVSEEDGEFVGAKMGNALVRQQAFKKLKGGTDKLNSDLLTNTLMNMSHLIEASAKNRAARAALSAAENMGAAQRVAPDMASYAASNGTMLPPGTKKTVWFQQNGKKVEYLVSDPFVMTAITSLEYAGMRNGVMDAMTKFKHLLTIGVTASPAFKVRNLIRDSIQAIGTSDLGYNPIKNVVDGFKQTNRESQAYVSALASGGLIRFGTMLEGSESSRVRQLIKAGVKDSSILNNEAKWRQFYDKYVDPAVSAYNELGNRSEEINRAALYNQLIKQGKSHGEAALMARDLMDFGMMGSFNTIRFLGQVVPFFNARLQGMYKLGRSAKDNPKKLAVVTGAVAVASIALMLGYEDDEDWKRREDWDRDGFWFFKFGGIEYRIPKPFEVGAVASLAERSVEYLINDEMTGERFRKVVGALAMNNLSMNPVPQMVKPMIDLYANKDSFTGRPIESMSMERLEKTMRFNSNTSMPARGLSNATLGLLSPVQYDHLARAYFGWLGAFAVGGADMAYRAVSDEPTQPALDYFKFFSQGILKEEGTGSSRYLSHLYDQAAELETVYSTYRQLLKDGKREDAIEYAEDNSDALRRYKSVESIKKVQTKMNQNIRAIERDPDMDSDEKKIRIDRIQKMKEQFAKRISPGA